MVKNEFESNRIESKLVTWNQPNSKFIIATEWNPMAVRIGTKSAIANPNSNLIESNTQLNLLLCYISQTFDIER